MNLTNMSADTMEHLMTKERKASLRKSNKPIMEKRRRARINSCLAQLKTLVLEAMRKDSSQYSKLEKADILEMTVKHLRSLQRQQMVSAIANDPNVVTKYRAGFHECANEVVRYLGSAQNVDPEVKSRLVGHLSTCLQSPNGVNQNINPTTCPVQVQPNQQVTQQNHLQPLRVQIPQNMNNLSSSVNSDNLLMTGNSQQTTPVTHVQSPSQYNTTRTTPVEKPTTHITGQFQILPGNLYNGPVAVYVGHVNQNQQSSPQSALPVFTLQVPKQQGDNVDNLRASPVSRNKENTNFSKSDSELYKMKSAHMQSFQHELISCKNVNEFSEKLWRPW